MKRVGLDCDGVLADFVSRFYEVFELDKNIKPDDFDIFNLLPFSERSEAKKVLNNGSFWSEIKPYAYVENFVDIFNAFDVEVCIVTAPWPSCPNWASVRIQWIKDHVGDYPVVITPDKQFVDVDVLLDDKPENVSKFLEKKTKGSYSYLVDRSYNKKHTYLPRVNLEHYEETNTWEDLYWKMENNYRMRCKL